MKPEKAFAQMQSQMQPGEEIVTRSGATLRPLKADGKQGDPLAGGAALTQSRLLFVGSLVMQRQSFSIPLASIVSVDEQRQALVTYTVITVQGGVSHRFYKLPPDFQAAIDQARFTGAGAVAPGRAAPPAGRSTADELAKLAELHASGVLTDSEFSAAKARLIG